ncbi:MAG: acetate--CoA ligase family protein [Syntrophobacteraceae bacterium]|jgi:hypothetical protein
MPLWSPIYLNLSAFGFEPLVMFGPGVILTAVLHDVTFRIAPVDDKDAEGMLHEIGSADLLAAFRGEDPVDRKSLVGTLTGLSHLIYRKS